VKSSICPSQLTNLFIKPLFNDKILKFKDKLDVKVNMLAIRDIVTIFNVVT
jgi:hypothetical protein